MRATAPLGTTPFRATLLKKQEDGTVSEVIVIGGGIAGICAALELLDAGRRVLILERDTEENFGGLAKESFGGIFLVGTPEQLSRFAEALPRWAEWVSG
jgi:glycine/D-amino acid oxidase-like deaminating enzyme